jgi:hypothetical protein
MKNITVKQNEEKNIPTEILADAIISISQGIKKLRSGRLNNTCLIILIQNAAPTFQGRPVAQRDIKAVLEGIDNLGKTYIRK